ncbi:2522_t:CDS:2 [Paraglomus brasilianum]|uniref:2522_t:CDS:1 n=1 Tax=Paraglomus brasilianum TaxID=144538 RepID=A0A9N9CJQ7_9GLOM|nr:2522_t:CDS:2 [Paraglomus brasilianum]
MYTVKIVFVIITLFVLSGVEAHFQLTTPPARGPLNEHMLGNSPCGEYNAVNTGSITTFSLTGQATSKFTDGDGNLVYRYAPNSNATFTKVSGNVPISAADTYPKEITTQVNLTLAGAHEGDQGVLQAYYVSSAGNESWYQCADIKVGNTSSAPTIASGTVMFYTILAVILMTNGYDFKF